MDRRQDGLSGPQVAIITAALLPESKAEDAGPFPDDQPLQQRAIGFFQESPHAGRERPFDRLEQQVDSGFTGRRSDEQMDMLGHEDIRDQAAPLADPGPLDRLGQQSPPMVIGQERHPPIRREGEFVAVAGLVESTDGFPVSAHAPKVNASDMAEQVAAISVRAPEHWSSTTSATLNGSPAATHQISHGWLADRNRPDPLRRPLPLGATGRTRPVLWCWPIFDSGATGGTPPVLRPTVRALVEYHQWHPAGSFSTCRACSIPLVAPRPGQFCPGHPRPDRRRRDFRAGDSTRRGRTSPGRC